MIYDDKKLPRPSEKRLKEIAEKFNMNLSDTQLKDYQKWVDNAMIIYDGLAQVQNDVPQVKYPRTPGYTPSKQENPLNAWFVKCEVKGQKYGKLEGKKIALKDCICLAGVPMMNGSRILEGYIPEVDATIVTRVLEAGGTIVGKANCECLCMSGGSITSAKGPVLNPHNSEHQAGGSTSGTAALVGSGAVDMGLGGDQGGSIRTPSSWCGVYGLKPTFGLVPYTGIFPIETSLDTTGPITKTAYDNALLLEVIAGPDGWDGRQAIPSSVSFDYTARINDGIKGLKIGVLKEGFGGPLSEKIVEEKVMNAVEIFKDFDAVVESISIPEHEYGPLLFYSIIMEGGHQILFQGNGFGAGTRGLYIPSLMKAHSQWKQQGNHLSTGSQLFAILGEYMWSEFQGTMYGKAQNLSHKVKQVYDEKLKEYDLIVMPTNPSRAPKFPELKNCNLDEYFKAITSMGNNTGIFNCTGHPALTIPIAKVDGLPIGMMIVSKYYGEELIYRAANSWASKVNWEKNN